MNLPLGADLALGATTRGKKRTYPIEREMEKCEACRRKKIKVSSRLRRMMLQEHCSILKHFVYHD
jgi:hypothetical protein